MDSTRDVVDLERIRNAFNCNRAQMTMQLAKELNVPEVTVIRALPDGLSVELPHYKWEQLLRSFERLGKVHVIVSNGAVTTEIFGHFGNFSLIDIFFNIQTPSLDMHLRYQEIDAIFAVIKPAHINGVETLSFQFFDKVGAAALKVFLTFGASPPSVIRRQQFDEIICLMTTVTETEIKALEGKV